MSRARSIGIWRCMNHRDVWGLHLDDERGGIRILGPKCCGRWQSVRAFPLSVADAREFVTALEVAIEEMEAE